ncbi:MAG: hypothetical protein AB1452_01980 [Pseudomonadota bacterium]
MRWFAVLLCAFSLNGFSQEKSETHELIGNLGGRAALLHLYATGQPDGGARLTGEYLLLPTLQQRFLEGERSKQLGVTFLREGDSPIFYGRPAGASLQGTWQGGVFKGARYGPKGQPRERFEFSESFPGMDGYSAAARCEIADARYKATLAYVVEGGKLKSLEWRSQLAPGGHACVLPALEQRPMQGGLAAAAGRCRVTLRDLGEFVRVAAEDCAEYCGSQAYLEPVLVDRRGGCTLLRPQQAR